MKNKIHANAYLLRPCYLYLVVYHKVLRMSNFFLQNFTVLNPIFSGLTHSPRLRGDKGGKSLKMTKNRDKILEKAKI